MDWTVGIGLALTAVAFLALTGLDAAVEGVESTACTSHLEQAVLMRSFLLGPWIKNRIPVLCMSC